MNKYLKSFLLVCAVFIGSQCYAVQYKIQGLDLWSASNSYPWKMDDKGFLAGTFVAKEGEFRQVFTWNKESGLTVLDQIPKGSTFEDFNHQGQVVGNFRSLDG